MKTNKRIIASALSCWYSGMPLDAIQRHLKQQFDIYFSESGIYNWAIRFSKQAIDRTKDYKPNVGDTWIADETAIRTGGKIVWFWDIIDRDTRYLLASHVSKKQTTKDAEIVMRKAMERAGKIPNQVITDKLKAYIDGIDIAFEGRAKHIQSKPFKDGDSTQMIERFHGTLKDRLKVVRGFSNMQTARILTDAWLVHYNFFKEHESLGNVPPAQEKNMPDTPIGDWVDVIEGKQRTREFVATTIPKRKSYIRKKKRRYKPKEVKEKEYTSSRIVEVRK